MTLPVDTMLENRYRIDRLIGQGGMGAIYQGYDTNLDIEVAIKENFLQMPQSILQFQQEARILAKLHHPALPRVMHHFSVAGQQYLVMDFIEGEDLWQIIKRSRKPLDEAQAVRYILQICEAVQYLHKQQPPIIHRDIKPQNIKVTPSGQAVLVDFGIAKIAEQGALTGTGARGVTPGFSPPEQYSGEGTSPRSDIYALGATLYALLTGEKPPDSISLLTGKVKFDALGPPKFNLSEPMLQAIRQAMQPLESNRPASVAAWQAELQKTVLTPVVRSEPILLDTEATMLTPLQSSPPAVTSSASNSSLWIGVGMGAVVVCIIIGVMAFVFSGGKEPSVAATTATVESTLAKATAESSIAKATIESNNTPEPVPTNTNTPKPVPPTNTNTPKPVPPTNTPKPVNPPTSATNCGAPLASATKYYDRGDKAFNEGNYECAIADFTQAIQLDPKYADAYFYRGMAYSDSDKFEQAMADYNQVIKLDPQNTNIYIEICWEGSFFGKVSEVMDACNKGVESGSPDLPRNSRGIARTLVGDYAGAIEDFKVSLAWEKQNGQSDSRWIAKEEFWITELEAGRNPFDAATLEKLRKGE